MALLTQSMSFLKEHQHRFTDRPHKDVHSGNLFIPGNQDTVAKLKRHPDDSLICISINSYLDLTGNIYLCPYVMISANAQLFTHLHQGSAELPLLLQEEQNPKAFTIPMDKTIGWDCWIYQSIILPQCTSIANGCIVGAGSVVTKPITEPYTIWGGNPAKQIGVR